MKLQKLTSLLMAGILALSVTPMPAGAESISDTPAAGSASPSGVVSSYTFEEVLAMDAEELMEEWAYPDDSRAVYESLCRYYDDTEGDSSFCNCGVDFTVYVADDTLSGALFAAREESGSSSYYPTEEFETYITDSLGLPDGYGIHIDQCRTGALSAPDVTILFSRSDFNGYTAKEINTKLYLYLSTSPKLCNHVVPIYAGTSVAPLYGDINQDGEVSLRDVIVMQKYIFGLTNINYGGELAADLNSDGRVNVIDLTLLKQMLTN